MRGSAADPAYLLQIIRYCEFTKRAITKIDADYRKFIDEDDRLVLDSCALYVGQIGECANKLTAEFKTKHSGIPWRQIIDLRNRIVHDYISVDTEILWEIVLNDVPRLGEQCRIILEEIAPTMAESLSAIDRSIIEGSIQ